MSESFIRDCLRRPVTALSRAGEITREGLEKILAKAPKVSHRWRNEILAVLVEYYLRKKLAGMFERRSVPEQMRVALQPYVSDIGTYLATFIAENTGTALHP